MLRLSPTLLLLACSNPPSGHRTYGGGELTVEFTDTANLGGTASQAGISAVGDDGAWLSEPADTAEWVTVQASMPAPAWDLFPTATDAVLEVELLLGREPQRAEIIRVEWIDPAGPRRHLAVRDVPVLTWPSAPSGSIVFADMPWESCPNDACEDVATGTTTVRWDFDPQPLADSTVSSP